MSSGCLATNECKLVLTLQILAFARTLCLLTLHSIVIFPPPPGEIGETAATTNYYVVRRRAVMVRDWEWLKRAAVHGDIKPSPLTFACALAGVEKCIHPLTGSGEIPQYYL